MKYVYTYWDELAELTIELAPNLLIIIQFAVIAALIAVYIYFSNVKASVPIETALLMIGLLNRLVINFMRKRLLNPVSYV